MWKIIGKHYERQAQWQEFGLERDAAIGKMHEVMDESGYSWFKESDTHFEVYERRDTENVLIMSLEVVESDEVLAAEKEE